MDPELLRLLLEVLRNQTTTGSADTGGTWPYDDYGLQNTIGGIGAVMGEGGGDFADGSIEAMNTNPTRHDTSPSTYGGAVPYVPPASVSPTRPVGMMSPEIGAILQQMQSGLGQRSVTPTGPPPTIQRSQGSSPRPVAAPVAGTAQPAPRGTPTPDPRRDVQTLPRLGGKDDSKKVRARVAPQQAARQIAAQARNTRAPQRRFSTPIPQQQRMFSAPAPTFTSAPSSRAAAQSTLASALAKLLR